MTVWQESGSGGSHDYFCDYSTQDITNIEMISWNIRISDRKQSNSWLTAAIGTTQ
jgi:hypothetical protein